MAKKEYTIKLVLDDSMSPDQPSETMQPRHGDTTQFTVRVNAKSRKDKPIDLAAHELGHVLGAVFETSRHEGDPRVSAPPEVVTMMNVFGPTPEMRDGMLASEEEAWELAEKMYPRIDQARKRWALGTYERA